ncbi:SCO family protein [Beggiatoa leptomitoformis]|uniref:Redoxin domain-containing protein n=1 Tax=Beggiatoa leptomitoformis TaxID=288004 RepID=A0A2N9YF81_9GAMM|nr:SCO family protein [Beggiatoa leptomitoformis]ALG69507.2 redoxin domain-containing protein [Beggiatoa leptomitoformis]AUI69019.1 redoxin domain-containing protein [Beggiatoa leptomitoformis]
MNKFTPLDAHEEKTMQHFIFYRWCFLYFCLQSIFVTAAPLGGNFSLTNTEGKSVALQDYAGQVVLLTFGFLSCPDICPTTLTELKQVINALPATQRDKVTVLFITVDPERDTAEKLKTYLQYFSPNFVGLRGSVAEIRNVCKQYGTSFRYLPKTEQGYSVEHASQLFIIDSTGKLVRLMPYGTPREIVVQYVAGLIH